MKTAIAFLLLTLCAFGQWQVIDRFASRPPWQYYEYNLLSSPDFAFDWQYPTFLIITNAQSINLLGHSLNASFTVECDPSATFRYGGPQGGGVPPSVRFFISTVSYYSNLDPGFTNFWWSDATWGAITNDGRVVILFDTLNSTQWSDGNGQVIPAVFQQSLTNVVQYGLAFGGPFFDTGITGNGIFHLLGFQIISNVTPINSGPISSSDE